jgi:hypothetical protein
MSVDHQYVEQVAYLAETLSRPCVGHRLGYRLGLAYGMILGMGGTP